MVQNWVGTLKEKTGRSLEEWLALVKKSGPKNRKRPACLAQKRIRIENQQRMVDCRARGRQRHLG